MIVEQVWTGNAYRNFNYLVACAETGDALAIDPLDFTKCLKVAVLVRVEDLRDRPAAFLRRGQALVEVERVYGERVTGLGAGDQVVEIAKGVGGPDLFDKHGRPPASSLRRHCRRCRRRRQSR